MQIKRKNDKKIATEELNFRQKKHLNQQNYQ